MAKFCPECGKKVENNQKLCDSCRAKRHGDSASHGGPWWILGLLLPPVGLILYLVWKNDRKADAKSVGTGALVSAIIWLFFGLSFLVNGKDKETTTTDNNLKEVTLTGASSDIQSWYADLQTDKTVVTVIALSYCEHCANFEPIITKIAEEYDLTLHIFNIDKLETVDSNALTGAYNLVQYEGASPYTFVAKSGTFLGDTVGEMDETNTLNFLKSIDALK